MSYLDKKDAISRMLRMDRVVLELGVGRGRTYKDSITIDRIDNEWVDVVANLDEGLGFCPDNSVDEVYSRHFLEHVDNLELLMQDIHRVLKAGGTMKAIVPHFSNPYYYSDYTHRRFFGLYSFSYFSESDHFRRPVPHFYNSVNFTVRSVRINITSPFPIRRRIKLLWNLLFNSCRYMQELYEENLCYIIPAYEVAFELEKKG